MIIPTFIDLFCGIGGFRLALEKAGFKCVFSAENNPHACQMYQANFQENPLCDITTLNPSTIPDFDVLCAGFPCQAFSIAGKQLGFKDQTRGTLFFDIVRILEFKKPKAFILENVKNLITHDQGKTLKIILKQLQHLGYHVNWKLLNASHFNTPQNRERIILVGNLLNKPFDFNKLNISHQPALKNYLSDNNVFLDPLEYTLLNAPVIQKKSGLIFSGYRNKNIRKKGVNENTIHLSRVHKQPNRIYSSEGTHPTLSSQEKSGRYFILHKGKVRKLTLDECYKIMGFPSNFIKIGSQSNLYERIGNSVCVPMIYEVALNVKKDCFA